MRAEVESYGQVSGSGGRGDRRGADGGSGDIGYGAGYEGLWCAWAVGESGALRIGIPEPEGDRLHLRRRFSRSMTAPIGRILRGELRMPERATPQWLPVDPAAPPVRSERFLRAIQARQGVLTCRVDGRLLLAFPRADDAPFPLEELFCFASFRQIKGSDFWIFAFDDAEWPVF